MKKLIYKARQGDGDAFAELIQLYMQDMYKVARAYLKNDEDAADAISETILTCYEKLDTLKSDRFFKTWLIRILINKCNDILRQKKNCVSCEQMNEPIFYEEDYSTMEWKQVLNSLDEKYRTIVILFYVEGLKIREIAEILEMKESTIQTRLFRARKILSDEYQIRIKQEVRP